ncbi:MAG: PilZ domain-containing protein [Acidobacteriia bacterium]|nr:PilZ domain-containing protein [Terriglobia bacterium]
MRLQLENSSNPDRRNTDRFPLENALRYRLPDGNQAGTGQTLNMSSGGILFTADSRLPIGQQIEVSVEWPAQLNARCGLKLVASGKIVRSSSDAAAVRIEKYDFRTRATAKVTVEASASAL